MLNQYEFLNVQIMQIQGCMYEHSEYFFPLIYVKIIYVSCLTSFDNLGNKKPIFEKIHSFIFFTHTLSHKNKF